MNKDAINQRIQALESELAGLKAELVKPEKVMFKYCNKRFNIGSLLEPIKKEDIPNNYSTTSFNYRQTEANAQADLQLQKELMCIGALAEQIDPNYKSKVIWGGDCNWAVFWNIETKKYAPTSNSVIRYLGVVYMPREVAEKVCEILNKKQVEL